MSKRLIANFRTALTLAVMSTATLPFAVAIGADERPDFSGVWGSYVEPGQDPFAGFGGPPPVLPFTEEGQRLRDEYQILIGPNRDNPGAFCVTYGMPTMMENVGGYPIEFIQQDDQFTMIYEVEGETRRVYFAGRGLPDDRRFANRQGYSTGYWDGDTMVVETNSLSDGQDQQTHPHSDQANIVERFSLSTDAEGTKVISYEMSMTDPVYYTEAVTIARKWAQIENGSGQILPYNCPEESWLELLELRREQLNAGEPVTATMEDVFANYE